MNLNDFFVQLFESEKRAKQRKEQLSEIQQEIKNTEIKIKEAGEEQINLKGQLAVKLQKLSEEEINLKWVRNKELTMTEQLDELKKKINQQSLIKNELKDKHDQKREEFMAQVGEFVSNFGLTCNGKKIRNVEASERCDALRKDEAILSAELQLLRNKQKESDDIEEEKTAIMEEVRAYRKRLKDLEAKLATAKTRTAEIISEKQQLANKPENGQEFQRLQQELEVCRRDSLEGLCQALQPEVDRLQRLVWQKRIQRPMVAVPPRNQPLPATTAPKFMPQRISNTYATRYGAAKPATNLRSNYQLSHQSSSGSKVTQSGKWNNKQLTLPPDSSDIEELDLEEVEDHHNENNGNSNTTNEQVVAEIIEDISDDELFLEDVLGESAASDDGLPQKAKRVRFQ